ncbi:MAG: NAD(P)-dependent oxidoreductase [Thermoguttaceae bacterium]|jgi:dTDP-4-dehydrorhamnose reductase
MKIAVTGALGQLGGELCRQIGPQAIPLDIDTLDLTDGGAVLEILAPLRAEMIINCAAYTQVDKAEKEPDLAYAVNAAAVKNLVRACRELDCPLVQISTDYVFGGERVRDTVGSGQGAVGSGQRETASGFKQNSHSDLHPSSFILHPSFNRPYREDDPPSPQGIYARTKLAGERAAAEYEKHLIVRTCGLYARASDGRANNFVKTMLRLGSKQAEIRVVADQHCTPSYVPHVARAVLFLAGLTNAVAAPWGIYHVTNSGETTWYDFAVEIFKQAGLNVSVKPITTAEYGATAARPSYSVLDTGAYHRLGGPAMPDWKTALEEYFIDWKTLKYE